MGWWDWLTSTEGFMSRSVCGMGWAESPTLRAVAITAGVTITVAYVLLPLTYYAIWHRWTRRRVEVAWDRVTVHVVALMAFVLSCAATHAMGDVVIFWWAAYHLDTAIKAVCAVISLGALVLAISELFRSS